MVLSKLSIFITWCINDFVTLVAFLLTQKKPKQWLYLKEGNAHHVALIVLIFWCLYFYIILNSVIFLVCFLKVLFFNLQWCESVAFKSRYKFCMIIKSSILQKLGSMNA